MSTQSAVTSIEDTETHAKTPALLGSKCPCCQWSTDSNVNPWKEEGRKGHEGPGVQGHSWQQTNKHTTKTSEFLKELKDRWNPHPSKQHALVVSPGSTTNGTLFPVSPLQPGKAGCLPFMEMPPPNHCLAPKARRHHFWLSL